MFITLLQLCGTASSVAKFTIRLTCHRYVRTSSSSIVYVSFSHFVYDVLRVILVFQHFYIIIRLFHILLKSESQSNIALAHCFTKGSTPMYLDFLSIHHIYATFEVVSRELESDDPDQVCFCFHRRIY